MTTDLGKQTVTWLNGTKFGQAKTTQRNHMVKYKDTYLAKGSEALKLYEAKDFKKLDKHLKELDKNLKELMERYK